MSRLVAWLGQRRKYLTAAAVGTVPVVGFYCGVAPYASVSHGAMWFAFFVYELGALGVHAVGNDAAVPPQAP